MYSFDQDSKILALDSQGGGGGSLLGGLLSLSVFILNLNLTLMIFSLLSQDITPDQCLRGKRLPTYTYFQSFYIFKIWTVRGKIALKSI